MGGAVGLNQGLFVSGKGDTQIITQGLIATGIPPDPPTTGKTSLPTITGTHPNPTGASTPTITVATEVT